jgi:hypothetical protein
VDVGAAQLSAGNRHPGLFQDLTGGGGFDRRIKGLDMPTRQEPAIEPAMMEDEQADATGRDHHSGSRDVSGSELIAGKGLGGLLEQHEDQLEAFGAGAVGGVREEGNKAGDCGGIDHINTKAPGVNRGL